MGDSLRDRKVAVLGMTFKRDSDDVRDSLSYKLVRLLERELAHVARHDPHVPAESEALEVALEGADAVVVATNHSGFEGLLGQVAEGTLLVDPWNVTGSGRVFGTVRERAAVEPA
jgi:UDP-N-acetyl-D-mannosaminuronic acid dehydrogenase